jgi:hypothetical protein
MRPALAIVLLAGALLPCQASADSPLVAGDEPDRIESKNKQFFAEPSANRKATIVYRRSKPKNVEIWRMAKWPYNAYLSDDGEYLTVGYPGNNLLDLDCTPALPMLQFYRRGTLIRSVTLGEVIIDMKSLQRTVSHYSWGYYRGHLGPNTVALDTIEGRRLIYDVTTGELVKTEAVKWIH